MIRFSALSRDSIDSFMVDETYNFYSPLTLGNSIIVHDYYTGFFYKIDSENKNIELYMDFDFAIPESQDLSVNYNHYQIMEGGDVYGCFNQLSSGESFIVNLTQKKVLNILKTNDLYNLLLYKEEEIQ